MAAALPALPSGKDKSTKAVAIASVSCGSTSTGKFVVSSVKCEGPRLHGGRRWTGGWGLGVRVFWCLEDLGANTPRLIDQ